MSKPSIKIEHFYESSTSEVWKALTQPSLLSEWWAPNDIAPIVGHKFQVDMGQWGKQECLVLEVQLEKLIKFSFALETEITWEIFSEKNGTRFTLTHEGFDLDSPMSKQAFEGMRHGWPGILQRLKDFLAKK